jgi:hypothetical protein
VGRHANGDQPTGVLFVKPPDPTFRRAASGKKAAKDKPGKSTQTMSAMPFLPAPTTQLIPAQRGPEPGPMRMASAPPAVLPPASAPPVRPMVPRQMGSGSPGWNAGPSAPPQARSISAPPAERFGIPLRERLSLPMWTKVCVVLGAVLILVGFGGLGAAYAVNQKADTGSAGSELIHR